MIRSRINYMLKKHLDQPQHGTELDYAKCTFSSMTLETQHNGSKSFKNTFVKSKRLS